MDYSPMTPSAADEIAEEFSIRGPARSIFDQMIVALEDALEHPEFEMPSVGGRQRYNELRQTERQIEAVRRLVVEAAVGSDPYGTPAKYMVRILPLDDDGSVAERQIFENMGLRSPIEAGVDIPSDDGVVLAIANYVLFKLARSYNVQTTFSAEARPRRRGRPRNKVLTRFVQIYLEHFIWHFGWYPRYGEMSICVTLCSRLLDYYGIDAPDVAQTIKRELRRRRER